jgi:uncharacterized membrane protein YuzA (DUF378 family)
LFLIDSNEEVDIMAHKMNGLQMASWIGTTVAGVHLGLVGAFGFNLFDSIFGAGSAVTRVIYVLIGLLGLYSLKHMIFMKK